MTKILILVKFVLKFFIRPDFQMTYHFKMESYTNHLWFFHIVHLEQYYELNINSWNMKVALNHSFREKKKNLDQNLFLPNLVPSLSQSVYLLLSGRCTTHSRLEQAGGI